MALAAWCRERLAAEVAGPALAAWDEPWALWTSA